MTHTGPMKDSEGTFRHWSLTAAGDYRCRRCRSALAVRYRPWESNDGAYEDTQFSCLACGHVWWVDGIDS